MDFVGKEIGQQPEKEKLGKAFDFIADRAKGKYGFWANLFSIG